MMHQRKMKQLGMLVVVAVALTGSMAWGQQPLKAAGQDAKPWVLHDQSELSGVAVDLTRAVSKQIGVPIEYQPMVFADLIPAVDTGRIDIIATNMAITSEREQKVDFTSPYYNALPEALVVQSSDATPYRALADLKGLPVGAQKGSIQLALLQKIGGFSDIKIYDSQKDARQAVASGQIRATITPGVETRYAAKTGELSHGRG
jgi:polar amino acid transport system substrate-binding protein